MEKQQFGDFINELKQKNDIISIASRYASLERKGRYYWCRCPFHGEKTASCSLNDIDNKNFFKKAYDIIQANKNSNSPEVLGLITAFDAAAPQYVIYNNGAEIKVKRDNTTRAEVLPYIEAIQKALDYYNQVHTK